ncbi:MAG TPA: glycosyl hydrolase family protein [bacterium (Candidatus Stahlbacteria)]|nr:glycosyl hydrolase family protein [Candidatus Stahlbacteria bacterium]
MRAPVTRKYYYFFKDWTKKENLPVSDLGWQIYPEGIYYVLRDLKKYNKPIYITENGYVV